MYCATTMRVVQELVKRVFHVLGPCHTEHVYANALQVELTGAFQDMLVQREVNVSYEYEGVNVGHGRIDLLLRRSSGECLVVEVKAVRSLQVTPVTHQVGHYLNALARSSQKKCTGLVVNFGWTSVDMFVVLAPVTNRAVYLSQTLEDFIAALDLL